MELGNASRHEQLTQQLGGVETRLEKAEVSMGNLEQWANTARADLAATKPLV